MNVRIALLAGLASFAVACSGNAPTEQEEETDEGALVAGEVESKRYASDVTWWTPRCLASTFGTTAW